ncbi:MAG: PAS domain-containing protein, partial [Gammaproteobacteria bacterium]|nr:PAS domain-containing protein [Gammaproteobacteria bacterium]
MFRLEFIRNKLIGLAITMFIAVLTTSGTGVYILYKTSLSERAEQLTEIAKINALMLESIAHFDKTHFSEMHSDKDTYDAALSQIIAAHKVMKFGHSGEFTLAKKEGNKIIFLMRNHLAGLDVPGSVLLDRANINTPMHRALSGESGWMTGYDFEGKYVMAAYEPVNIYNLGIVAKIDMQEIQAPFIKASLVIICLAILVSLAALRIFYQTSKHICKKLEDSNQHIILLAKNAKDMIYRMSIPEGIYEYVSPASTELFGVAPEEFYQSPKKIRNLIHPDWLSYFEKQWQKLITGDMPPTYEYQIITPLGETKWINQRNVLILDDDNKPVAIEGIVSDITEHKTFMQKLMHEKQIAQSYLDIAGVIMVALDSQGNIILINQKACELLGWSEHEAIGMNWFDNFLPKDAREDVQKVFEQIMSGNIEAVEFHENTILSRDGKKRTIAWHNSIVMDSEGKTITEL